MGRWPVIEFNDIGGLTSPVAIAGFEGWNDAGEAASGVVNHLGIAWQATPIGAIDPEDYYDFQVNRPTVTLIDGLSRSIEWPTSRYAHATAAPGERDILLLRGLEPNMRWRGFCAELIDLAKELRVSSVITLGALLSDSPHTRPVPVSGNASDEETAARLNLERSRYEGPTGIVGVFSDACAKAGFPAVAFWAAVPHYAAQPPCPKATLALLHRVEDMLDLTVPLGDLPDEARAWENGVDELAREDNEIAEYVRSLEAREAEVDLPEASGEAIAREFERFLRRRGGQTDA